MSNDQFWDNFIRAVEAEPKEVTSLKGASGLTHPIIALGLDGPRRRIIVISGDPDARSAALAQADIQAAQPSSKVIFARPIAINLSSVATAITNQFGKAIFDLSDFPKAPLRGKRKENFNAKLKQIVENSFKLAMQGIGHAKLQPLAAWQDVILQLSHLQFDFDVAQDKLASIKPDGDVKPPSIKLGGLIALDPAEVDRRFGICSVPLYQLSEEEAALFHVPDKFEEMRELLRKMEVLQYFFPPPDQLALGLIEHGSAHSNTLAEFIRTAPAIGHPLGLAELIPQDTPLEHILSVLKEKGLSAEGEVGLELTEAGKTSRATIRFKPREGFFAKLARVLSIKIDLSLKDLFK